MENKWLNRGKYQKSRITLCILYRPIMKVNNWALIIIIINNKDNAVLINPIFFILNIYSAFPSTGLRWHPFYFLSHVMVKYQNKWRQNNLRSYLKALSCTPWYVHLFMSVCERKQWLLSLVRIANQNNGIPSEGSPLAWVADCCPPVFLPPVQPPPGLPHPIGLHFGALWTQGWTSLPFQPLWAPGPQHSTSLRVQS